MFRRHSVHVALVVAAVTAVVLPSTIQPAKASAATCAAASAKPEAGTRQAAVRATLCLLNATRRRHRLPALGLNHRLSRAAYGHSEDMVQHHYFSHTSRSGATFVARIRHTGYLRSAREWKVGENLALGRPTWARPTTVVRAWMKSPRHRANILDSSFSEIGIGLVRAAPGRGWGAAVAYTTDFGVTR